MMRSDDATMLRAGPAFLATLVLAAAVGGAFGHLPAPEVVERRLEQQRMRVLLGTWLESVAAALLVLFSAGLHSRLRRSSPDAAALAAVSLAGGTATAGVLLAKAAVVAAAAERAGGAGASRETMVLAADVGNLLVGKMAPIGLALMTGATTVAARRSRMLPAWLVRTGPALTVGLLSPVNFVFVVGGAAWVAVAGWLLGRGGETESS